MAITVIGIRQVKSNLQKKLESIAGEVTERSITAGAIQLSAYASELTPVDTSNLINSQYIIPAMQTASGWQSGVGYAANYAEVTHDGADKNWKKAGAENQYLLKAAERNQSQIFSTIVKEYRRQ